MSAALTMLGGSYVRVAHSPEEVAGFVDDCTHVGGTFLRLDRHGDGGTKREVYVRAALIAIIDPYPLP